MSTFADQILLRFLDDAFVRSFLVDRLGLAPLFNAGYEPQDFDLQELSLDTVDRREMAVPTVETIRVSGSEERITPTAERYQLERQMKRFGRLVWVDVRLDVTLAAKVHVTSMPLDSIRVKKLLDELGGAASIAELRTKLLARYPVSVVDAMFRELRITTIEDYRSRGDLLVEFLFQEAPPFDPADPANTRRLALTLCLKLQPELKLGEALQEAKLTRSVLQREADFLASRDGAEIKSPYVFATVFPDAAAVDNALPGLTAAQIKTGAQSLFAAEGMLAHFFA
jgi:hypothetical protein